MSSALPASSCTDSITHDGTEGTSLAQRCWGCTSSKLRAKPSNGVSRHPPAACAWQESVCTTQQARCWMLRHLPQEDEAVWAQLPQMGRLAARYVSCYATDSPACHYYCSDASSNGSLWVVDYRCNGYRCNGYRSNGYRCNARRQLEWRRGRGRGCLPWLGRISSSRVCTSQSARLRASRSTRSRSHVSGAELCVAEAEAGTCR